MNSPSSQSSTLSRPFSGRDNVLDAVGGLLIIHMILGHILAWSYLKHTVVYRWMDLLYFFMPWFFYKSGQFHRDGPFLRTLGRSARRLLVPYVVFSAIGYAVKCYTLSWHPTWSGRMTDIGHRLLHDSVILGATPLWFLMALFVVKVVYAIVPDRLRPVAMTLCILGAFASQHFLSVSDPVYFASWGAGFFFYAMGHVSTRISPRPSWVAVAFILYVGIFLIQPSTLDMRTHLLYRGHYALWVVGSLAGIVGINASFRYLPHVLLRPLAWIGERSMICYVTHLPLINLVKFVVRKQLGCTDNLVLCFSLVGACLLILPLLCVLFRTRWLRWMMGERVTMPSCFCRFLSLHQ